MFGELNHLKEDHGWIYLPQHYPSGYELCDGICELVHAEALKTPSRLSQEDHEAC